METTAYYTTQTQLITTPSDGEQAIGTDFTIYAREGGIDVEKVRASGMHFTLMQIGIGMQVSRLLDEQIQNAIDGGRDFGFFHLPSAYAGPVKDQARLAVNAVKERGYGSRLIVGDLEPAIEGDYGSLITPDQGWIYHQELEYQAGRRQAEYSNPNVLKYRWYEPNWIYNVDWIMARYPLIYDPELGKGRYYYYFDEFLAVYPWTHVYGYLPDAFYNDCVIGTQFTKKLRAQEYFASTTWI